MNSIVYKYARNEIRPSSVMALTMVYYVRPALIKHQSHYDQ